MNAATVPRSSPAAATAGHLVVLLATAAFLLAGLTGNSFSLHVGMATMAPVATSSTAEVDDSLGPLAVASTLTEATGEGSRDSATPMPISSETQHLMHLLGACLAVVAAAALLLALLLLGRVVSGSYMAVPAIPRLVTPRALAGWSPPALSPPTSSPVIRT